MASLADSSQMDAVKVLLLALFLCWTSQSLTVSDAKELDCVCSLCGDCGGRGPKGPPGERGEIGLKGVPGSRGPEGAPGRPGEKGLMGDQGVQGQQGKQGTPGAAGVPGPEGPQGVQGQQGKQGAPGAPGEPGPNGTQGVKGRPGRQGYAGQYGRRGFPGPDGKPLSPEDILKVAQEIEHLKMFSTELSKIRASQMAIQECGVHGSSWRQIVHIDMTASDRKAQCPYTLCTEFGERIGCYKSGCSALQFNITGDYTHVCGRVSGYQLGNTTGFKFVGQIEVDTINTSTPYADGVLITSNNYQEHLWAYVADTTKERCPCGGGANLVPDPISDWYHCNVEKRTEIGWDNPLWDKCDTAKYNECCEGRKMHGWFYRNITQPINSIEVRWCTPEDGHIVTDILQIWVQ